MKNSKHILFGGLTLASIATIIIAIIGVFIIATVKSTAWLVVILVSLAWLFFAFFVNAEEDGMSDAEKASAKKWEKIYMLISLVANVVTIIILLLSFFGFGVTATTPVEDIDTTETTTVTKVAEESDVVIDTTAKGTAAQPQGTVATTAKGTAEQTQGTVATTVKGTAAQTQGTVATTQKTTTTKADSFWDKLFGDKETTTKATTQKPATTTTTTTEKPATTKPATTTTTEKPATTKPATTTTTEKPATTTTTKPDPTTAHKHAVARYENSKTTYEQNGSKHFKVVYQGDKICSCNYNMGKGNTTRTEENHSFGSNDKCICGYTKPTTTQAPTTTTHKHAVARYENSKTTYEQNGSKHFKVVYQGDKVCDCGHNIGKGTTTRTEENHSFGSNDKCICGYTKPTTTQAKPEIILHCTRQDAYGDPAMGPNDTVTLELKNMSVSDVEYYWVHPTTGTRQTTGVTLTHLYGNIYEITLSDEVWKCAADIQIRRPGTSNWYTVTLEPQY